MTSHPPTDPSPSPELSAFAGLNRESLSEVASAVSFVRDHGEALLSIVGSLPEIVAAAARGLTEAAVDTRAAATLLTGPDDATAPAGVKALAHLAGEALDACRRELGQARELLESLAGELGDVPIPSLEPTYSEVLGHRIITGLDLGDGRLLAPASERLKQGAARFEGVGDQLGAVAEHLRAIGGLVGDAGAGLARTADKLAQGGQALGRLPG